MTSPHETGAQECTEAMAIEDIAADWSAAQRVGTDWSAERQAELDAWLERSLAHRIAYIRIEATWRRTARLAALHQPMRLPIENRPLRKALWTRIVGVLGFVLLTSVVVGNYVSRPKGQLIETPKGGQERLTLIDGTRIELNTDTAIRVDVGAATRNVELVRGEAFFHVKHETSRPFVVTAADHRIVDLGTKFLVQMAPKSVRVALVEGSARFESLNNSHQQHAVVLAPGDVAIATAYATRISKKSEQELSEGLAWQRGAIIFRNSRLADAVAEFNRYGGPELIVTDDVAAKRRINGTFLITGAEDFAGIVHEIFGLHLVRRNGSIFLSSR